MKEIRDRRSIRKYLPTPVEEEKLTALIEAARLAPSGCNVQDWHFIVIRSQEGCRKVAASGLNQPWMITAPAFILCITGLEKRAPELSELKLTGDLPQLAMKGAIRDLAIAGEHIVLEAQHLGLGTCWVGSVDREMLHREFGIPENKYILAALSVGYAAEDPAPRPRKPLADILHHERW